MRYEAKHSYFKRLARVLNNFKNIPKTLAEHHQRYMCYHMSNTAEYLRSHHEYGPGNDVTNASFWTKLCVLVHAYWYLYLLIVVTICFIRASAAGTRLTLQELDYQEVLLRAVPELDDDSVLYRCVPWLPIGMLKSMDFEELLNAT